MKIYTDDCPSIELIEIPYANKIDKDFFYEDTFEEWQPFRLNINIIGGNNKFYIKRDWWRQMQYNKTKNRFYWKSPKWK